MAVVSITVLFAAFINGGIGYGFSSVTVPVALLFYTNRVLNPALVLVEAGVNIYSLILNRKSLRQVWPRVRTFVIGLIPAVALGSFLLRSIDASWVKSGTYLCLVPLILLQSFGLRRPIQSHRARVGVPFGAGIGFLYSLTTISGPPLALMLNNEGFEKRDFRAALAIIRVVESVFTALAYYLLGVFSRESGELLRQIVPWVVVGMPLGAYVLNRLDAAFFRRVCISIDVWLIGFGLYRVLSANGLPTALTAAIIAAMVLTDGFNLRRFIRSARKGSEKSLLPPVSRAA